VFEGVEKELGTAIGVFLPASEFVINGQRDTFFEAVAENSAEAENVAVGLQAEGHVEVFADGVFGPVLLRRATGKGEGDVLDGGPAEDGVVADEGGDVAISDTEADSSVDEVGKEGDTLFKERGGNVHDTGGELDDGDRRGLLHLADSVKEAVIWDSGVGVDDKDVVSDSEVTISPSSAFVVFYDLCEALLIESIFIILVPGAFFMHSAHRFLDSVADVECVIHVGSLLELAGSNENVIAIGVTFWLMFWSGHPSDVVVFVELASRICLFW